MNNIDLTLISMEDLKEELKRRQRPCPLESPDLTALTRICQAYIRWVDGPNFDASSDSVGGDDGIDFSNDIEVIALRTIFGEDIYKWLNPKLRGE